MTTLRKFKAADAKVTEIENNGGIFIDGYTTGTSPEYDQALEEAQKLFAELDAQGIDPFDNQ